MGRRHDRGCACCSALRQSLALIDRRTTPNVSPTMHARLLVLAAVLAAASAAGVTGGGAAETAAAGTPEAHGGGAAAAAVGDGAVIPEAGDRLATVTTPDAAHQVS